jgi:argininosuccinate lyase
MLPQKRNPDVAELVRGRTGTMIGRLTGFLATLKGLPLAYARDLQEDKESTFRTADTFSSTCEALSGLAAGLKPDESVMRAAALNGETIAVDLAERLVHLGIPFREAHAIVGKAVRLSRQRKVPLSELSVERDLTHLHPLLAQLNIESLDVDGSIDSKRSPGSTSRDDVVKQLKVLERGMQEAFDVADHIRPTLDLG